MVSLLPDGGLLVELFTGIPLALFCVFVYGWSFTLYWINKRPDGYQQRKFALAPVLEVMCFSIQAREKR